MKMKKIHFVGIKGVGMTPLAIIAKEAGYRVTGSDIPDEFITDAALKKAGITPLSGFSKDHINGADLVIATGAHKGLDNPEVREAQIDSIPVLMQGQAVGRFMEGSIFGKKNTEGISVAGTHGKTTTTAFIATLLLENGKDPSFVIGTGDVESLGGPGHFGSGSYFVAEADEYATEPKYDKTPKFLWQNPKILVITNIEFDHPDVYRSIDEIREAYGKFVGQLKNDGVLIVYGDDREARKMLSIHSGQKITYGFNDQNDYILKDVRVSAGQTFFWVEGHKADLGQFTIRLIGEHNALNALSAIAVGLELGISVEGIKKGLLAFGGTKRRMEYKGALATGALLFDDYAHHPTEIEKTLSSIRKNYPDFKIVCIFQPHTYSRTKMLFNDFARAFSSADELIMLPIYASLREEVDETVSSKQLVNAIGYNHKGVSDAKNQQDVVQYIFENKFGPKVIVITMGAGDVYKIHEKLIHVK